MQAMADIEETRASAQHKQMQAMKTQQEAMMAPRQMAMDFVSEQANREEARRSADEDRKIAAKRSQAPR